MINPYTILGGVLLLIAVAVGGYSFGHKYGTATQAATDQKTFDSINAQLTKQKADANALMQGKQAEIIALQTERDNFKTQLEAQYAQNRKATESLRGQLASVKLRFAAAKNTGSGTNGSSTVSGTSNAAGNAATTYCVVSDTVDATLKSIVHDADTLRDDYTLLYNWAHGVK